MNIWRKIYNNQGNLLMFCIMWVMIWSIILKLYNAIYFIPSQHGSHLNALKAPLFSFEYIKDYFSNPISILLLGVAIFPPCIFYFIASLSSNIVQRENKKFRENEIKEFMNGLQSKNKQPKKLPKNQKRKKKQRNLKS